MAIALVLLVVVGMVLLVVSRYRQTKRALPGARPLPGPKGLPFIGRVHDIPKEKTWLKFHEWSKEYGPIFKHEMLGTTHVWIASEKVANELLAKKANIYSDRPMIPNLPDNRTSGHYLALLGRTDTWKRQRKLCNHLMRQAHQASLHSYPALERDRFLFLLWRDPSNYIEWIEQFTSRTVSRLSWGTAHPALTLRKTTFGLLETISPAGALPNILSFLRHVPEVVSPWKRKEKARHRLETQLFTSSVDWVKARMTEDAAPESFVKTFLEAKHGRADASGDTAEATNVVGLMAIAGALTIGSPVQSYILAMLHYPEWQHKLHDEINSVCGGRCPQWEDREKLPLLRAVVKEVIRWRPPVPTGIPHAVEEDDVYEGFFIPKGAIIHALEWSIARDATTYPNPEAFNPARWIEPSYPTFRAPLTQYPNLSGYSQFGFGRRVCQGIPIVEQDLFLAMGGMAWAFQLQKKPGVPVHWNDFTPLLIAKPARFEFDAVPRGEERMALMTLMYECARAQDDGDDVDGIGTGDDFVPAEKGQMRMSNMGGEQKRDVLINLADSNLETDEKERAEPFVDVQAVPGAWV